MKYITANGLEEMHQDLRKKKEITLPRITKEYNEAVADGDGEHDNAMFRNKKHELTYLLEEIAKLEETIRTASVINNLNKENITIGSKIKILDLDTGVEKEIILASSEEIVYLKNAVSIDSPLGKELIGKSVKDKIIIELPNNKSKKYEILAIV
jgi:transcription elongation factor GreA